MNTSTQFYTTHFLSVSVSVNTPLSSQVSVFIIHLTYASLQNPQLKCAMLLLSHEKPNIHSQPFKSIPFTLLSFWTSFILDENVLEKTLYKKILKILLQKPAEKPKFTK